MDMEMEKFIPLSDLYRKLYETWKKSHPTLSGTAVREHVVAYWHATIDKRVPETQWTVQQKIRELSQGVGIVQPKLPKSQPKQPTLNELWWGSSTLDKNKGVAAKAKVQPQTQQNFRKRKNVDGRNTGGNPSIVITLDEDGTEIMTLNSKPLVVLEVFELQESTATHASYPMDCSDSEPAEGGTSSEGIGAEKADNRNDNGQTEVMSGSVKTEKNTDSIDNSDIDSGFNDSASKDQYEKPDIDLNQGAGLDIRIRSLSSLMEEQEP